ncbi:unnamed protein product [Sympodiomycopsis kandeliae]
MTQRCRLSALKSPTNMPSTTKRSGLLLSLIAFLIVSLFSQATLAYPSSGPVSATGSRILILNSRSSPKSRFGAFSENLAAKGFELTWRDAATSEPKLTEYDERQYDHIVFLGTDQDKVASDVSPQSLVSFAKDGGNILFAFDSQRADWLRDLAREFSVEVTGKGETLIDHFHYAKSESLDDGTHSAIFVGADKDGAGGLVSHDAVISPETQDAALKTPLLFGKSAAHRIGGNPQAFSIVKPSSTSYTSTGGKNSELNLLGTDDGLSLITSFQLKENSARVSFIGSLDFLSDDFVELQSATSSSGASHTDTLNAAVLNDVTLWTFQSHGVLKVTRRAHRRVRTSPTDIREPYEESADGSVAKMYRIKDTVTYGLDVAQFDSRSGGWIPAPADLDLQVKLIMIDPFITTNLTAQTTASTSSSDVDPLDNLADQTKSSTLYTSTFTLPDRLGVYTFQTHWSRTGWSFINVKDITPIRAFNHDENPRYLPATWPYVIASFSTIGGFLLFVALWLFTSEKVEKGKTE